MTCSGRKIVRYGYLTDALLGQQGISARYGGLSALSATGKACKIESVLS